MPMKKREQTAKYAKYAKNPDRSPESRSGFAYFAYFAVQENPWERIWGQVRGLGQAVFSKVRAGRPENPQAWTPTLRSAAVPGCGFKPCLAALKSAGGIALGSGNAIVTRLCKGCYAWCLGAAPGIGRSYRSWMIFFGVVLQICRAYGAASARIGYAEGGTQRRRRGISVEPRRPRNDSPGGATYSETVLRCFR
jgi:hypothetical protein